MRSKAICLALLAFAFGAQARLVVDSEVSRAARAWTRSGQAVSRVTAYQTDADETFFAAKLADGGTIFLSGDTERRPVIAYVAATNDFASIDRASPLWALLNRDQCKIATAQASSGVGTTSAGRVVSSAEAEWAALLAEADVISPKTASTPLTTHVKVLTDVRAGPLLQSTWAQGKVGGKECYNYYTPQLSDGTRAVCGCVATAMAQVMRYHQFPTAAIASVTRKCTVEASTRSQTAATANLTTQGGKYDWAKMPLNPSASITDVQRQAIGKLTSDVGISVYMNYNTTKNGGSGAFTFNVVGALKGVFGYASACYYSADEITENEKAVRNAMLSNFDAGYPVLMGIDGDGGHAIVGDGYGYKSGKLYVHLNMGWSGQDDVWYNLPDIDCSQAGYHFTVFDDLVYNIFPTADEGLATLTGRVTDDEGNGSVGLSVTVRRTGETEVVATDETTNAGVYGVRVPAGTYDVEVRSSISGQKEMLTAVDVAEPKTETQTLRGIINKDSGWIETYKNIPIVVSVGNNKAKNDLVLYAPTVQIGENTYSRLDMALTDAKAIYAADPTKPVAVRVLADTELRVTSTIDFPCEVSSTAGSIFTVTRGADAGFVVAEGGRLMLADVAFASSGTVLAEVDVGGNVRLGDGVSLGVAAEAVAIRTATADGFTLAGDLQTGFTIDCAAARTVGAAFGSVEGLPDDAASVSAAKIANAADEFGEIRGIAQAGVLKWAEIPVPLAEAVGYYVGVDGVTTNTSARIDRLLPKFMDALADGTVEPGRTLTILKSGTLTCRLTGGTDFTLRGVGGAVISNGVAETMSEAGFVITNGTMTVRDLTFDGFSGVQFLVVNGADAGCVLGSGTKLRNIVRTGNSDASGQGPIAVRKGFLRIEGAEIADCRAAATSGGGVYLAGAGCRLEMAGGIITNCTAVGMGGGVYAGAQSAVRLSGDARIVGNTSSKGVDNLYLGSGVRIEVVGVMSAGEIGVRSATASANKLGGVFATGSEQVLESSAGSFRNDGHADYVAVAASSQLSWATAPVEPEHRPLDPSESARAAARLVYPDRTELWETAQWALESLTNYTGTAVVELLKDGYFDADLAIAGSVTVRSSDAICTLSRAPGGRLSVADGATLSLTDVILRGINADDDKPSQLPLIKATGGEVTLGAGAVIEDVRGAGARDAGAVVIWADGVFRMGDGAIVRRCSNAYVNVGEGTGVGAALLVDEGTAYLSGGTITECSAYKAGGVFIGNEAVVHVSGEMWITNNVAFSGDGPNLLVSDLSTLYLDGKMTGRIGYTEGVRKDYDVFGEAGSGFGGSEADLAVSARNFYHDRTLDVGSAVIGAQRTLLVWSGAVSPTGIYVDSKGDAYQIAQGGEPIVVSRPGVATGLVYDGSEQCGVPAGVGYEVTGNRATDAGTYCAVVTLRIGFVWDDATTAPLDLDWVIAKATYDMSGVRFENKTCVYDGAVKYIEVAPGQLPVGVSVSYLNNNQTEIGVYEVTARFVGDGKNYEPIGDMKATLTILDKPEPPPTPTPVPCQPFAFTAISEKADGSWLVTISPAVKYCTYTLLVSDDLMTWTPVVEDFEATESGTLEFNPAAGTGKKFWKAIGKDGVEPID